MYNKTISLWEETDNDTSNITATASADGKFVSAEVSHFTPYVTGDFPPDLLIKFIEFFGSSEDANAAFTQYKDWMLNTVQIFDMQTI